MRISHPRVWLATAVAPSWFVTAAVSLSRYWESYPIGSPPAGFEFGRTGRGAEGKWIVRIEKGADKNHVLLQESADPTDYRFPVAVLNRAAYQDLTLIVRAPPSPPQVPQASRLSCPY